MSRAYFNEYQKTVQPVKNDPKFWNMSNIADMEKIFYKKGYRFVTCHSRADHNGVMHNAWVVPREHTGLLIEFLFRQRIMVEVEAVKGHNANIIFVCDDSYTLIKGFINRIPKVEE